MTTDINADWANLAKYRGANEKLKETSFARDRIVFVGDSITESWIELSPEFHFSMNLLKVYQLELGISI